MRQIAEKLTHGIKEELIQLSEYIFNNPELGYEEFKACEAHVKLLKRHGFVVEEGFLDIKTAFKAVYDSGIPGPVVAFLSEYDALPGMGHGCGHNLLGATTTGAGITVSKLMKEMGLRGKVMVFGTPAEETSGAKVQMTNEGAFEDVDVAMQAHPASQHMKSGKSLALEAIQFTFTGKSAHAAASPEEGINALDAAINTFVSINALRQHILPSARIHGIISEGGKAANIVPDLAIAQFYVRATTKTYLQELVEKVKNCARAGAMAAGAKVEFYNYEASYDNLVTNETLSEAYSRRLMEVGVEKIEGAKKGYGSLDLGNISHVGPTIHPYFRICEENIPAHTKAFAAATQTPFAYESMVKTINALALTATDVLEDEKLLKKIKEEFQKAEK
ncbi:amidohydrolase [Alkaliphilus metalliredigens QYMF]|uniref:Peptidase M20 domain-containing protein 2 n=1 Tax=Alkaliphilus metalliredigens (strain QYMF) TaxID=293826 RepID=A6TJB7_ALKMQ|nr:M20 family metallopeptidase [Alkaliphilus metalliredigens]ABR46285.1 amidohydrolase [Alkaliphilus metalliredigens QYMF]